MLDLWIYMGGKYSCSVGGCRFDPFMYVAGAAPADVPAAVGKAFKEPGLGDTVSIKSGSSLVTPPPRGSLLAFQNLQDIHRFLPYATLTCLKADPVHYLLGDFAKDDLMICLAF